MIDESSNTAGTLTVESRLVNCIGEFLALAGPRLEDQLAALEGVINGVADVFDVTCTGHLSQTFADLANDQVVQLRADNVELITRCQGVKDAAQTLTAVMARIGTTYRFSTDEG